MLDESRFAKDNAATMIGVKEIHQNSDGEWERKTRGRPVEDWLSEVAKELVQCPCWFKPTGVASYVWRMTGQSKWMPKKTCEGK